MTPLDTRQISQRSQPEPRRLVIDEDISFKLAHELRKRSRAATAPRIEQMDGLKDGALFKALRDFEPYVLVTWDNKMPFRHCRELEAHGTTLAVVNRDAFYRATRYRDESEYIRDVVHRWAHVIEAQPANTVRRFSHTTASRPKLPSVYVATTRLPRYCSRPSGHA